jgi:NAD-dependent dihydropyrimidine dehydrogenase PreA subunit
MSYIIGNKCIDVKDGVCIEVCPIEDCIMEAEESMYINPETCINCGACIYECPVNAIYESEDEAIDFGEVKAVHNNYEFFGFKFNE